MNMRAWCMILHSSLDPRRGPMMGTSRLKGAGTFGGELGELSDPKEA